MPDTEAAVVIWITEGTWQASVDAALRFVQPGAPITLLHVTPAELSDTAHGAYLGLFGRGRPDRDPGPHVAKLAAQSAAGTPRRRRRPPRPGRCRIERSGAPEREVVTAVAGAALLIVARDGDRSRLGPKSLGKATRFVVDHAPCPVLVVWPEAAPAVATIPPPPPHPPDPPKPPGPPGP